MIEGIKCLIIDLNYCNMFYMKELVNVVILIIVFFIIASILRFTGIPGLEIFNVIASCLFVVYLIVLLYKINKRKG